MRLSKKKNPLAAAFLAGADWRSNYNHHPRRDKFEAAAADYAELIGNESCPLPIADNAEILRLRAEVDQWRVNSRENKLIAESLQHDLAERDALLRRVHQADALSHSCPLWNDIDAALSASAEPSAPVAHPINMKTIMQAYEQVDHKALLHGTSNWCASMAAALRGVLNAESSAPVERDERAEFEAAYIAEYNAALGSASTVEELRALREGEGYGERPYLNGQWKGWQSRAALERKP